MSWWRSDDWQDVIADSSDPAVARLALNAAAGRSIGFDALADAAEDPAVVYAYNRAGADADYASDVVSALDVYDRTTTALMAAGMPESIAASRAALVFGIPMVDSRYLEVAKQPVMPADILVASADEALARAFAHLVPDVVAKADEPWDESEVNRDDLGRFAPETGAQQAYRVVDGRKVAISTQVKTGQQTQKQAQEVKASSTDKEMLEELARQNEEKKQFASAKRAKRLKRLNRLRGAQSQQRAQREAREAKAAQAQATTKVTTSEAKAESKAKVLERRELLRGMTREQKQAYLSEQKQKRQREAYDKQQRELAERLSLVSQRRTGGPRFRPEDYDPWTEEGDSPDDMTIVSEDEYAEFKENGGDMTITLTDPNARVLVRRDSKEAIDGGNLVKTLLIARQEILDSLGLVTPVGIDSDDEAHGHMTSAMDTIIDRVFSPYRRNQIPSDVLVWIEPGMYATLADLMQAVTDATGQTGVDGYIDHEFPVQILDQESGSFVTEERTITIPSYASQQKAHHMYITQGRPPGDFRKAAEAWDESEVKRDAIGRFAPEGTREAVVGGRKVLMKVEQGGQKVESKKEIERTSTDTQDLAWVAQRNREAALRRRRLARLSRVQSQQRTQADTKVQKPVAQAEQKAEEKKTKTLKVYDRRELLRGLTQEQKQARTKTLVTSQSAEAVDESLRGTAGATAISSKSTVGYHLAMLAETLKEYGDDPERIPVLRISPDTEYDLFPKAIKTLRPVSSGHHTGVMQSAFAPKGSYVDPDSVELLVRYTSESHPPVDLHIYGEGTKADPFELVSFEVPKNQQGYEKPTGIETYTQEELRR